MTIFKIGGMDKNGNQLIRVETENGGFTIQRICVLNTRRYGKGEELNVSEIALVLDYISKNGTTRQKSLVLKKFYVVQGYYDKLNGWENLTFDESLTEARQTLKEYDQNETNYNHRIKIQYGV